jgi:hypothetical protein
MERGRFAAAITRMQATRILKYLRKSALENLRNPRSKFRNFNPSYSSNAEYFNAAVYNHFYNSALTH